MGDRARAAAQDGGRARVLYGPFVMRPCYTASGEDITHERDGNA